MGIMSPFSLRLIPGLPTGAPSFPTGKVLPVAVVPTGTHEKVPHIRARCKFNDGRTLVNAGGIPIPHHISFPLERDTIPSMFNFSSVVASIFGRGQASDHSALTQNTDWLHLPAWTHGTTDIQVPQHYGIAQYEQVLVTHDRSSAATLRQIKMSGIYGVNLAENSCACRDWERSRKGFPVDDLRRVCKHIARAINHRQAEFDGTWNAWTRNILLAIEREFSYGVFPEFTSSFFKNGAERYLLLYDNSRGYVELFSESGGCFGYDSSRNRWASGEGPNDPLVVKQFLRPWIESLDARFKNGKFENS
jgi:hypothetical protein